MNELQRHVLVTRQTKFVIQRELKREAATTVQDTTSKDSVYRVLVSLIRSDRPRYWNFLCHNCGAKVAELQNYEVYTLDDFYDPQNINNAAVGRRCSGLQRQCPYIYFFRAS